LHEQFGYAYDKAWNLSYRTNNALIETFGVNNLNELSTNGHNGTMTVAGSTTEPPSSGAYGVTSVTVSGTGLSSGAANLYADATWTRAGATPANGNSTYTATAQDTDGRTSTDTVNCYLPAAVTFQYDLRGNLTNDGLRTFQYDTENQLTNVSVAAAWRSDFIYDGLLRRRVRKEYTWSGGTWVKTNEVRYIYDRNLVIQERDANNLPTTTLTRGSDLSSSFQGAGGIGGLLARTDTHLFTIGDPNAHALYHADAGGNITCLTSTNGIVVARYSYDPFGNLLSRSGSLADANLYRFSSKEWHPNSGIYCYGFRFYEPNLQRWLNRDPLEEDGGINLYRFVSSAPVGSIDPDGDCGAAAAAAVVGGEVLGGPVAWLGSAMAAGAALIVGYDLTHPSTPSAPALGASYGGRGGVNAPPQTVTFDTKSWGHESPNPDKTGKRGDHKNRPDGKRDRAKQEPEDPDWWNRPREPHENTPNTDNNPYIGPPKDAGPAPCP
jgi:RHS repeat-associated protein